MYHDLGGQARRDGLLLRPLRHRAGAVGHRRQGGGQPVYNLLGGPCREQVRVYANGWGDGGDARNALARGARQVVERGFTALKFDPFPGPWRDDHRPRRGAAGRGERAARCARRSGRTSTSWSRCTAGSRPSTRCALARHAGGVRPFLVRGAGLVAQHGRPRRGEARYPTSPS